MTMNFGRQGVVTPQDQTREEGRGEPGKVYNAVPVELVAVRYADETGKLIREFWYKIGDTLYQPPQSEQFAASVRTVKDSYANQVNVILKSVFGDDSDLPSTDAVDVVSEQTAQQQSVTKSDSGVDV
jgi:hypothetical protein